MDVLAREVRSIYPTRPDDAFHVVAGGRVIGSVFRNWQGWIAAMWREHPLQANTSIHDTRELALAACGVKS